MAKRSKSASAKGKGKAVETSSNVEGNNANEINHTPYKATADTLHKNHSEVIQAPVAKKQFHLDIMGFIAGPFPSNLFLDTWLPIQDPNYSGHDQIENADFSLVWNDSVPPEVRMYNPLVRGFVTSRLWKLNITHDNYRLQKSTLAALTHSSFCILLLTRLKSVREPGLDQTLV